MHKFFNLFLFLLIFFNVSHLHPFVVINDLSPDEIWTKTEFVLSGHVGYSGYINVNQTMDANLFYIFWESLDQNPDAPVLLWLQGGPGCSSLWGLFKENGPLLIQSDGSLLTNPWTWNNNYAILYIDNPVGAGFSYSTNPKGYVTSESQMSQDLYTGLKVFFAKYTKYSANDFYVFGESYAGKYVPAIAYRIHEDGNKLNMKGFGIGDGLSDPSLQTNYFADYSYSTGLLDEQERIDIKLLEADLLLQIENQEWDNCLDNFEKITNEISELSGGINKYDIRLYQPYDSKPITNFLNLQSVKDTFGANADWEFCAKETRNGLKIDFCQSVKPLVDVLIQSGYQALFYSGQFDLIVNYMGSSNFIEQINWSGKQNWLESDRIVWKNNDEVVGYVKNYQNLYHILINKAGHMSPMNQPQNTLDMVSRFINNKPFS
ncbi:serine carboxypeptidase-like 48-related [Anaeramoeba flamelloides]|uniref:Carboxypeptidase n=1 Tax=Anaeramoeba flamelloides TaxID=1746091 RepID=A0ABQ8Z5M1_9EUKA|nr:serine carboxypeptidase-like 48-related [Anaeramoeba flamelloides]